ncbi:MAG: hypothetical protein JEZ12_16290 [Desulfobacterium sp.]|nr:hypothetical protein [Desulfobacterium sp.]
MVINTEKPEESGLVDNYNVRFAPLPMVVILAPNGALTGNFKKAFTQDQVEAMLLSPVSQQCLLAFQQQKIVFLCVQGKNTASNPEALDGVKRFRNEPTLKKFSEVVMIDPTDPDEKKLLGQLGIASETAVAETFLLAPPGRVVNKWTGPTSKEAINKALRTLMKAQQACQIPNCGDPSCETPKESSPQGGVN